jgi:hypothetical protein
MSQHKDVRQNHEVKIVNRLFENVKLKYFAIPVRNKKMTQAMEYGYEILIMECKEFV